MYMRLSHVHVTKIRHATPDGPDMGGGGYPPVKKSGPVIFVGQCYPPSPLPGSKIQKSGSQLII